MSDAPDDIWGAYAKSVKKLHGPAVEETPRKPKKKKPQPQEEPLPWVELLDDPVKTVPFVPAAFVQVEVPPPPKLTAKPAWKKEPLDLRVERNMSLGDVVVEAKLDLHGQTEAEAYEAFRAFIETQAARGKRMLLVITGKGQAEPSVLRTNLPRWCSVAPFDECVLAVRTAAQHHGGDGAYYVLLRKRA